MDRQRLLRISVVDESAHSPRTADDETGGDWTWRPNAAPTHDLTNISRSPTPLHQLQSPNVFPNGRAHSPPMGIRRRRMSSPVSRGAAVMEKIMNPPLDRESYEVETPPLRTGSHHIKASAFDDDYHSVYVAQYPGGMRGLFVLFQSPTLLVAVGLFSAFVGLFVDFWLAKIADYRNALTDIGFRYLLLSALVAAGFATVLTHVICPQAAGSGLPHMRVAISGVDMSEYLTFRCIVTKIVGLIAVFFAGLSVGKEGPFIMISCAFASVLMNLSAFHRINNDDNKRLEMLACACSAGVAATFGSPFGGVLFGVEVTSHFYMVRTLPRSFFAAIVGALFINFITSNTRYGLFGSSNMGISTAVADLHDFSARDLVLFIVMGMVCGLGGAVFNFCISLLVRLRDKFLRETRPSSGAVPSSTLARWRRAVRGSLTSALGKRLLLVLVVTFVSCVMEFYGDSAWFIRHGSPHRILGALFSKDKRPFTEPSNQHNEGDDDSILLSRSLITYLPLKYVLTLLSVVLPVPAGLFTPTFVIGGIFGRLVGEGIKAYGLLDTQYEPFEFAIIGAGAFSSGVTHAISTAVIIMEISHSDGLNLPVSIAILASYFTAKRFTDNVYDVLISTSNLPRLKKLPKAAYDIPLWEVMRDVDDMSYLTADSTYRDALEVLRRSREPMFPIVDDRDNLFLLATVTRRRLEDAVAYCQQKMQEHSRRTSQMAHTPLRSAVSMPINTTPSYGAIHEHEIDTQGLLAIDLLDWPMHFAFRRGGRVMEWGTNEVCTRTKLTVLINPSPFQLMEMTPMKRVDLLFRMLKLNNAYITRSGRLVGLITRDRLMSFLGKTKKFRVPGLCTCAMSAVQHATANGETPALEQLELMRDDMFRELKTVSALTLEARMTPESDGAALKRAQDAVLEHIERYRKLLRDLPTIEVDSDDDDEYPTSQAVEASIRPWTLEETLLNLHQQLAQRLRTPPEVSCKLQKETQAIVDQIAVVNAEIAQTTKDLVEMKRRRPELPLYERIRRLDAFLSFPMPSDDSDDSDDQR